MKRNLKPAYIKKLMEIKTGNGYKVDIANYFYNPTIGHEYPALIKLIEETPEKRTFCRYYFFKLEKGGAIYKEVYTIPNNNETHNISHQTSDDLIKRVDRFNINDLILAAAEEA